MDLTTENYANQTKRTPRKQQQTMRFITRPSAKSPRRRNNDTDNVFEFTVNGTLFLQ